MHGREEGKHMRNSGTRQYREQKKVPEKLLVFSEIRDEDQSAMKRNNQRIREFLEVKIRKVSSMPPLQI